VYHDEPAYATVYYKKGSVQGPPKRDELKTHGPATRQWEEARHENVAKQHLQEEDDSMRLS